jgi:hypothetical protein
MKARAGTTLLELVVALAITGAVALIGSATFGQLLDRRTTIVDAVRETERAGARRALVRAWVADGLVEAPATTRRVESLAATMERRRRDRAPDQPAVPREAMARGDALVVTTNALTPVEARGVRVRLYVDADPETPERGLTAEFQAARIGPMQRRELDPDVADMQVEYLDARTGRWIASRDASVASVRAARVTLLDRARDERRDAAPGGSVSGREAPDGRSRVRLRTLPITLPMTPAFPRPVRPETTEGTTTSPAGAR